MKNKTKKSEKKKILLVEDSPTQAMQTIRLLKENELFIISQAENGMTALLKSREEKPDLILSDVLMPEMDGFELCQKIRSDPELKDIPIILQTSSYQSQEDIDFGLDTGADAYIPKEASSESLISLIYKVTSQKSLRVNRNREKEGDVRAKFDILHHQRILFNLIEKSADLEKVNTFLKESEKRFNAVAELSGEWIWETDPQGLFTFASPVAEQILGYSPKEIVGKKYFSDFFSLEINRDVNEAINKIFASRKPYKELFHDFRTKDGRLVSLETNILPINDMSGTFIGMGGISSDITERKRAEKTLRENENFLDSVIENIPNMIFVKDAQDLTYIRINKAGEELLGISKQNLLGKSDQEFFPPVQAEYFKKGDRETINNRKLLDIPDEVIQTKKGEERTLHTKKITVLDEAGNPKYLLGISEDITNRILSENKLLDALNGTINLAAAMVEARDPYTAGHQKRVSELASAIAATINLSKEQVEAIRMAGVLHDLGKIRIPAEILSKPGKLSEIEFDMIKTHPQIGYDLLKNVNFPWPLAKIIQQHHERMDGSGYPEGLKGDAIMLESRILAVADMVEAMSSHRPYRAALGIEAALGQITKEKGTLLDANVVDACLKLFKEGYKLQAD